MKFLLFLLLLSQSVYSSIHPISHLELTDINELAPLKKIVKDSTMVGLGESAHGSKNYIKAQLKLIKYLVEEMNFDTIMFEEGYAELELAQEYLKSCLLDQENESQLINAIKKLNPVSQNKEMRDIFSYLCMFSKQKQKNIYLTGFDIWVYPWSDRTIINKLILKASKQEIKNEYNRAYENCWVWKANSWEEASSLAEYKYIEQNWRVDPSRHIPCIGSLTNLKNIMMYQKDELIKESSLELYNKAMSAILNQLAYQEYRDLYVLNTSKALNIRENAQAIHIINYLLDSSKKAILLAHNVHISKDQFNVIPSYPAQWDNVRSLGEKMVGLKGQNYKAIAVTGYNVTDIRGNQFPIPKSDESLENYLKDLGDIFLIDVKNTTEIDLTKKWWMHWETFENGSYLTPARQYDGIFFVKDSPGATLLNLAI